MTRQVLWFTTTPLQKSRSWFLSSFTVSEWPVTRVLRTGFPRKCRKWPHPPFASTLLLWWQTKLSNENKTLYSGIFSRWIFFPFEMSFFYFEGWFRVLFQMFDLNGVYHEKAGVRWIEKMWLFLSVECFKPELLAVKVGWKLRFPPHCIVIGMERTNFSKMSARWRCCNFTLQLFIILLNNR